MALSHQDLIALLKREGYLKSHEIIAAFQAVDRAEFVPPEIKEEAYANVALSIGFGQTISQPLTVAFMLEILAPKKGDKILEVGFGSGWQTALLAHIVGSGGHVYAMELVPQLYDFGHRNVAKYHFRNVTFFAQDASEGLAHHAPYDRVVAAAASQSHIPDAWKAQVKIGGRIVSPVGSSIWQFDKVSDYHWEEREYPGFAFVPLVEKG
ncbi:MAG: protein-L-isoaspartate O-methyltransferase [bacterium]|nr:protein-L-isoaspartate O-methyltransferase [bacterium]